MSDFSFTDNSEQVKRELEEKMKAALTAVGMHLESEAKKELETRPRRVDTGLLRNSITWALSGEAPAISFYESNSTHGDTAATKRRKIAGKPVEPITHGEYSGTAPDSSNDNPAVYIGTNVEYAEYVHDGTSRMNPNRFLKNACQRNKAQIKTFLESELKG